MTSPGEAIAETFAGARRILALLSEQELREYGQYVETIAKHEKYRSVDDALSGLTAQGKVQAIDQALARYRPAAPGVEE